MYPRYPYNNRNLSHNELLDIIELFLKNYNRPITTIHNYYYTQPPPSENSQYEVSHRNHQDSTNREISSNLNVNRTETNRTPLTNNNSDLNNSNLNNSNLNNIVDNIMSELGEGNRTGNLNNIFQSTRDNILSNHSDIIPNTNNIRSNTGQNESNIRPNNFEIYISERNISDNEISEETV